MTTPAELIERLASRDGDVRTAAADALYDLGVKLASPGAVADSELDDVDFHERNEDNSRRIVEVYRSTNDAQAAGEAFTEWKKAVGS